MPTAGSWWRQERAGLCHAPPPPNVPLPERSVGKCLLAQLMALCRASPSGDSYKTPRVYCRTAHLVSYMKSKYVITVLTGYRKKHSHPN